MKVKSSSANYLAKKERAFRDYPDLLKLLTKIDIPKLEEVITPTGLQESLLIILRRQRKLNFLMKFPKGIIFQFSLMKGRGQELIYVLFVDVGKPHVCLLLGIETPSTLLYKYIFTSTLNNK